MTESNGSAATPFELLGHEIRVSILDALVERRREDPRDPALQFNELRDIAGVRDSGQFNYHLEKLRGHFVDENDDGYTLSAAGNEVVGAILSGSFETGRDRGPVELADDCGYCGASVSGRYEDGVLVADCDDGHTVHSDYVSPGILQRLSIPEAFDLSVLLGHHTIELLMRGVCPDCDGPADGSIQRGPELDTHYQARCDRCGFFFTGPPSLPILTHPALRSLYLDRGRDVRTASLWTLPFLVDQDSWEVESEDPLQVRIDVREGTGGRTFLIDEDGTVLEHDPID